MYSIVKHVLVLKASLRIHVTMLYSGHYTFTNHSMSSSAKMVISLVFNDALSVFSFKID